MKNKTEQDIIAAVEKIYKWIDAKIPSPNPCLACGRCCNFESFGHKLFVTTPEMIYFAEKVTQLKPMPADPCPYNVNGKCSVYKHRFTSCRIFNCKTNPEVQNTLTENALKKLKNLCDTFNIHYRYTDLKTTLNT